jgi:hypothetical protein
MDSSANLLEREVEEFAFEQVCPETNTSFFAARPTK